MLLAPQVQLSGQVVHIPGGRAGIDSTIRTMRALVNRYRTDVNLRQVAIACIYTTPAKQDWAEISAVFDFVRDQIRYVRDIHDVETISTPIKTLQQRIGDCDDKSVLLATLLETVGYPTRFVVTGYGAPGNLEHVYVQAWGNGQWVDLDSTENYEAGVAPPNPTTQLFEHV